MTGHRPTPLWRRLGLVAGLPGVVLGAAGLWSVMATAVQAGPQHVDQAVLLLRGGCQLDNAKLDLIKGNDGRLFLQLSVAGTPRARTSLVHSDVERFTDVTLRLQGEQSLEMSACMGPAVNQIIGTLLSLPPEVASLPLTTAPPSGGYVPPMLPQTAPPPAVASVVPPAPQAPATPGTAGDNAPLQISFTPIDIAPARGSRGPVLKATMGIDIRNVTNAPLRITLNQPWPVLHLEGGMQLNTDAGEVSGLAAVGSASVQHCNYYRERFTLLRPGQSLSATVVFQAGLNDRDPPQATWARLSGQILIENTDSLRCWNEPLAAPRIAVTMRR